MCANMCAGIHILMCWCYAFMFIGTGACRDVFHHFDDSRSGSQKKWEGSWWKRSGGPVKVGGECFTYTIWNQTVVLVSMAEPYIRLILTVKCKILEYACRYFYNHFLHSSQNCRSDLCPATSTVVSALRVFVWTVAVTFDPPTMWNLLNVVKLWKETDAAKRLLLDLGRGWAAESLEPKREWLSCLTGPVRICSE